MLRSIQALLGFATVLTASTQVLAIDVSVVAAKQGNVLVIRSSEPGAERFDISPGNGELAITHNHGGSKQPETEYWSYGLFDRVIFHGDDDRDEFYNWTEKPLRAYGYGGNDVLRGGGADDVLVGGVGKDFLYGLGGDDELYPGMDLEEGAVDGGTGIDYAELVSIELRVMFYRIIYHTRFEDGLVGVELVDRQTEVMGAPEFLDHISTP